VGSNRLILYWLTVVVQSTTVKKFYGQVETFRQSSSTIGSAFQAFCFARVRCCFAKLLGCRHIRSEGSYQLFKGLTFWSLGRGCFIQRAGRQNNPRSKKHWTTNTLGRAMVFFFDGRAHLGLWLGCTAHENGSARHCANTVLGHSGLGTCVFGRLPRTDCWSLFYFPIFYQGHITTITPKLTSSLHIRITQSHPIHTLHAFDWKVAKIYTTPLFPLKVWLFLCYMGNGEKEEF